MDHQKKLHIPVIDSLRGLAALMVCLYHFVYTTTDYVHEEWVRSFFHLGYYGVHIFFVISGIVIPLSMIQGNYRHASWLRYLIRRFVRIEPPYLASIVIAVIYLSLRNYIPGTAEVDLRPDGMTLLLHLGYLIPFFEGFHWINNVYWSLAVEFQYYLLLCLFFPFLLRPNFWKRVCVYALFFLAPIFLPLSSGFLPVWLPLFMVGISYALWRHEKIGATEFLGLQVISFAMVYNQIDHRAALFALGTIGLVHFLPHWRNGLSHFMGKISYSLYLIHTLTGAAIINYLSHSYRLPWQKFAVISLGLLLTIGLSYLMYLCVEKPSQALARKVKF